ncbi:hypothetical protein NQL31_002853 [Lotmaria passim]
MSEKQMLGVKVYHYTDANPSNTPPSPSDNQLSQQPSLSDAQAESRKDNLIYWLRGLPFQTTEADLVAFLVSVPAYHRIDLGVLQSGECSGNAFVELSTDAYKAEIEGLHNRPISCAAHGHMTSDRRPRPRFVEVIPTTASQRAEQLREDASVTRAQLPAHRQAKAHAEAAAAATAAAAVGVGSSLSGTFQAPQPQALPSTLQDSQHPSSSFSLPTSQQQHQQQSPSPHYSLIPTNALLQRLYAPASTSSIPEVTSSFLSSPRSLTHPSAQSSPRFGESMAQSQSSQQQQQQQGSSSYSAQSLSSHSHSHYPRRPQQ